MCFVLKQANRRGDRTAIPGVSHSACKESKSQSPHLAPPQSPGTRTLPRGSLSSSSIPCPAFMSKILLLLVPLFYSHLSLARLFQSLPDDLYAFPKYRVSFLNGLPLLNETAERWLREGLRGGEPEFLDHPTQWQDPPPFKHIDAGDGTTVGPCLPL
jgi:hypothetical protein